MRLASRPGPDVEPWGWLVTWQVASDDLDLGPSTVANALNGPTSVATGRPTCYGTAPLPVRLGVVVPRDLQGAGGAHYYLRQVALESVVAEWMRVGAVISAHRALLAGARAAEVAAAMGCSCRELTRRWRSWAEGQAQLSQRIPGIGLTGEAFALVEDRLARVCDDCVEAGHEQVGTHVGSPRS